MKVVPALEEINYLIKKIYETSTKLDNNLKINSTDDAANFVAYLYGFPSWKHYLSFVEQQKELSFKKSYIFKAKKFKEYSIKYELNDYFQNLTKSVSQRTIIDNQESNLIPFERLIGKRKNNLSKGYQPVGLLAQNTLVVGSENSNMKNIYEKQVDWLIEHKQCFHILGLKEDLSLKVDSYKIGKNHLRLDPLSEALEFDYFESFLDINRDENSHFSMLWIMLVNTLKQNYGVKWNTQNLLDSLKLENLLKVSEEIKNNHPLVAQALLKYLLKFNINVEDDILVSVSAQEKHYKQIYFLKEKLEFLNLLYQEGYFSENSNLSLINALNEKKSILFFELEDPKQRENYWNILSNYYINSFKYYEKKLTTEHLSISKNKIWTIIWQCDNKITEEYAYDYISLSNVILTGYVFSEENYLSKWYEYIEQIIFTNNHIKDFPVEWKNKALNNTQDWEENLWLNYYEILRNIPAENAFVWRRKIGVDDFKIEPFEFIKITLY